MSVYQPYDEEAMSDEELQAKADQFDAQWEHSSGNSYPAMPPKRDYLGRPISD